MIYDQDYDLKKFGDIMLTIRQNRQFTQKKIRDLCGIHPDTIKGLEYGQKYPSLDTLSKLSEVYHVNVLNILEECRFDNDEFLKEINSRIDDMSYNDNLEETDKVIKEVKAYIKSKKNNYPERIIIKIKQLEIFSQLLKIKNKTDNNSIIITEQLCLDALQLKIPDFSITKVKDHYYSLLEYRIIMVLSFSYTRQRKHELAISLIDFVIENLNFQAKSNVKAVNLLLLAFFFKAYQLYIIDSNEEVIETCDMAILLSKNWYNLKYLPSLYFRKAVSEHNLGIESYKETFKACYDALMVLNNDKMTQAYIDIMADKYHLTFE